MESPREVIREHVKISVDRVVCTPWARVLNKHAAASTVERVFCYLSLPIMTSVWESVWKFAIRLESAKITATMAALGYLHEKTK